MERHEHEKVQHAPKVRLLGALCARWTTLPCVHARTHQQSLSSKALQQKLTHTPAHTRTQQTAQCRSRPSTTTTWPRPRWNVRVGVRRPGGEEGGWGGGKVERGRNNTSVRPPISCSQHTHNPVLLPPQHTHFTHTQSASRTLTRARAWAGASRCAAMTCRPPTLPMSARPALRRSTASE
jgi:hypothetical protein